MAYLALFAMLLQKAQPQSQQQLLGMPLWVWWIIGAVILVLYIMKRNARKSKEKKRI